MSIRDIQLGNLLCDQDKLILSLFDNIPVKYIGTDKNFSKNLIVDDNSKFVIAIFNNPGYLSDLINFIKENISNCNTFYVGINRYFILGNDTNFIFENGSSEKLIKFLKICLENINFEITKYGHFDNDCGQYFNFIQPLTWIYGKNKSN